MIGSMKIVGQVQTNRAYEATSARAEVLVQKIGCPEGTKARIDQFDVGEPGTARITCWASGVDEAKATTVLVFPPAIDPYRYYSDELYDDEWDEHESWSRDHFDCRVEQWRVLDKRRIHIMNGEDWLLSTYDYAIVDSGHDALGVTICKNPA